MRRPASIYKASEMERGMDKKLVYTPRLRPDLVKGLWELKQRVSKPMTVLLAEAVEIYLGRKQ